MEYQAMRRCREVNDIRQMFLTALGQIRSSDVKQRRVK